MVMWPRSDQIHLSGLLDRLHTLVDQQLPVDVLDVKLDRVQAEEELAQGYRNLLRTCRDGAALDTGEP